MAFVPIPIPDNYEPWRYWLPQEGPQVRAATCPADEVFYGGTRGGGKAMPKSSKLLTNFGPILLRDVKVGSQVCNPDGSVAKVIQIHEQGEQDVYEFTFDDGAKTRATLDHLWLYRETQRKLKADRRYLHNDESVRWRVGTTEYLIDRLGVTDGIRIPLTKPIKYTKSWRHPLLIDPYLMGLMLGDGCFNKKNVGISSGDAEIAADCVKWGYSLHNRTDLYSLGLSKESELYAQFKRAGLLGKLADTKFIPAQYKLGSVEDRWAVIQGLMDTDGYADGRGHLQFTTVSEQLVNDVREIVWGLGGKATLTTKTGQYRKDDGTIQHCKTVYMLYIQHPTKEKFFRLERKSSRCIDKEWNNGWELTRKLISIEKVGREDCCCISIDHPNQLYLSDDFIVTHNSHTTIGRHVYGALRYGYAWNGIIFRRKYKDFREMRRQWDEIIQQKKLPAIRVGGEEQPNYIRFENGAIISMIAIQHVDQLSDHIGQAYTEISYEEAPEFPFLPIMIDKMKGSCRSAHGVPCRMFLTGNPGGPAASVIKAMFIPLSEQGGNPVDEGKIWTLKNGTTRVFIRSTYEDNKILMDADPGYRQRLGAIHDENLRAAWKDGRWDKFIGQAFNFSERHILNSRQQIWPIPSWAPLYMTFDWGYGAPFSVGWWWVDGDDRVYRFAEWYGTNTESPGVGLRIVDPKVAEGIMEREKLLGISDREIKRLGGGDCFSKKPDYKGGGQGDSTYHEFMKTGEKLGPKIIGKPYDLRLFRGDVDRPVKIQQFRNRLELPDDPDEMPMIMVYDTCTEFIRTIPSLSMDEVKREDLEDHQEDHIYDEACHICMDRPHGIAPEELLQRRKKLETDAKKEQLDNASRSATEEFQQLVRQMEEGEGDPDDWGGDETLSKHFDDVFNV